LITDQAFIRLPSTIATNMSGFSAPSLNPSDFLSIGDRLAGKKIDNAIENARYAEFHSKAHKQAATLPRISTSPTSPYSHSTAARNSTP
jgi:hypothetical protein